MLGHLRIAIKVYIHQSNHQKTQTIGVKIKSTKINEMYSLFALSY